MYDIEREKKILEILEQRGTIGVNRLASLIYCSGSTVRRDLTKLENFQNVEVSRRLAPDLWKSCN